MDYSVDPKLLSASFFIPAEIADKHLKLATRDQLRVILYVFRNIAEHPDANKISAALNMTLCDVKDAIGYWSDAGILICEQAPLPRLTNAQRRECKVKSPQEKKLQYSATAMKDCLFCSAKFKLALQGR